MITGDAVGNKPASFYFNISCVFEKGRLEKAICVRIMGVERQKKCEGGGSVGGGMIQSYGGYFEMPPRREKILLSENGG